MTDKILTETSRSVCSFAWFNLTALGIHTNRQGWKKHVPWVIPCVDHNVERKNTRFAPLFHGFPNINPWLDFQDALRPRTEWWSVIVRKEQSQLVIVVFKNLRTFSRLRRLSQIERAMTFHAALLREREELQEPRGKDKWKTLASSGGEVWRSWQVSR